MARGTFTASFNNISATVLQDIMSLQPGSNSAFEIEEIVLGQITQTAIELVQISLKVFAAGFSIGSGGSSITPYKNAPNDASSLVTARRNDTTQTVVGTGSIRYRRDDIFNLVTPYSYIPTDEDVSILIKPNECFVLSLDSAPAAARYISCAIVFRELF